MAQEAELEAGPFAWLDYGTVTEKADPVMVSDKPILAPKIRKEVEKGKADLRSKNYDDATSELKLAINAAPGNPEVNFLLGLSLMATDKLNQADVYLSRSYSLDPDDPVTLTAIGMLRVKQSQFDRAVSALRAAINLNHGFYLAHLTLASAFFAERNFSDAVGEARLALKQGKRNAGEAKFIMGASLVSMGKRNEAMKPLQEFVAEFPEGPAARDASMLLARLKSHD